MQSSYEKAEAVLSQEKGHHVAARAISDKTK